MAAKKRRAAPNWTAIKAEYIAGAKAPDLARKHKVALATVETKASREKWGALRKEVASKTQVEMPDAVAGRVLESATDAVAAHYGGWNKFATAILLMLKSATTPQQVKDLANAYRLATEGQRKALGLDRDDGDRRTDVPDEIKRLAYDGGAEQPGQIFTPPGADDDTS